MCIECVVRWNGEKKNLTNDFRKKYAFISIAG